MLHLYAPHRFRTLLAHAIWEDDAPLWPAVRTLLPLIGGVVTYIVQLLSVEENLATSSSVQPCSSGQGVVDGIDFGIGSGGVWRAWGSDVNTTAAPVAVKISSLGSQRGIATAVVLLVLAFKDPVMEILEGYRERNKQLLFVHALTGGIQDIAEAVRVGDFVRLSAYEIDKLLMDRWKRVHRKRLGWRRFVPFYGWWKRTRYLYFWGIDDATCQDSLVHLRSAAESPEKSKLAERPRRLRDDGYDVHEEGWC